MFSKQQTVLLENYFKTNQIPSPGACNHFAKKFGKAVTQITNWFNARREREIKYKIRHHQELGVADELNSVLTISADKEAKMILLDSDEDGYVALEEEEEVNLTEYQPLYFYYY